MTLFETQCTIEYHAVYQMVLFSVTLSDLE